MSDYIDRETSMQLLDAMPTIRYRTLFALVRFCGLNAAQAARLRWSDVDLDGRWLTVTGQHGKYRTPLLDPVPELLRLTGALSFTYETRFFGVTLNRRSSIGRVHRPITTLRRSLARDMEEAGIPFRAVNAWLHLNYRRAQHASSDDHRTALSRLTCKAPTGKGLELLIR